MPLGGSLRAAAMGQGMDQPALARKAKYRVKDYALFLTCLCQIRRNREIFLSSVAGGRLTAIVAARLAAFLSAFRLRLAASEVLPQRRRQPPRFWLAARAVGGVARTLGHGRRLRLWPPYGKDRRIVPARCCDATGPQVIPAAVAQW